MIVTEADLPRIRMLHSGQRIVYAGGTFDILHRGHMDFLLAAKDAGDILVMSIASDAEVRVRKGPGRPLHSQGIRAHAIDDTQLPDYTVIRSEITDLSESMHHTARLLKPDIVFYGPDVPDNLLVSGRREFGHNSIVVDAQPKVMSTTAIIRQMQAQPT